MGSLYTLLSHDDLWRAGPESFLRGKEFADLLREKRINAEHEIHSASPTQIQTFLVVYQCIINPSAMALKPKEKMFRIATVIDGHFIRGHVGFSPAPKSGIFTELARFEAERIVAHMVHEHIDAGRE